MRHGEEIGKAVKILNDKIAQLREVAGNSIDNLDSLLVFDRCMTTVSVLTSIRDQILVCGVDDE